MGKRGPAPKDAAQRSRLTSVRIESDLRAKLDAAVKSRKSLSWNLSREISARLARTFIEDESATKDFGSRRHYLIMRIAALAMQTARNPDRPTVDWLDDPLAFQIAMQTMTSILFVIRPPGKVPKLSTPKAEQQAYWAPSIASLHVWEWIRTEAKSFGTPRGYRDSMAKLLKSDLAEIVDRIPKNIPRADSKGKWLSIAQWTVKFDRERKKQ